MVVMRPPLFSLRLASAPPTSSFGVLIAATFPRSVPFFARAPSSSSTSPCSRCYGTSSSSSPSSSSARPPSTSAQPSAQAPTPQPNQKRPPPATLVEEIAQLRDQPLPYLDRALGLPDPPTSRKKTWEEKRAELLDRDLHMAKRRHIVKEATKGYFHDFHRLRAHGGKTWRSPTTLIREDKALYIPDVSGVTLSDRSSVHLADMIQSKVSIVAFLGSRMSEEHVKSFVEPTLRAYSKDSDFQFIQASDMSIPTILINLQENPLKSLLVTFFLSSLRRTVPETQQRTYLLSSQNMEYLREPMGMENKHVGYVYLVGPEGKIRWGGGGFALADDGGSGAEGEGQEGVEKGTGTGNTARAKKEVGEAEALASCTGVLLSRMKERRKK